MVRDLSECSLSRPLARAEVERHASQQPFMYASQRQEPVGEAVDDQDGESRQSALQDTRV